MRLKIMRMKSTMKKRKGMIMQMKMMKMMENEEDVVKDCHCESEDKGQRESRRKEDVPGNDSRKRSDSNRTEVG